MVKCDPRQGKYMAYCRQYLGDVTNKDTGAAVSLCLGGAPVGISSAPPAVVPGCELAPVNRSVSAFSNISIFGQIWSRLNEKFDPQYSIRAFVQLYVDGSMEESEFVEVSENSDTLENEYQDINHGYQ
ncbi:Tubulin alpha chain-like 3 [Linnemannia schmuckeri]|uniref:Tubulin alpha chain-like 3 n=1 Tax=Linnemannia schmuckeri TaxID=64567 RepID=A0A9P5R5I7_9FUNG|nr:Tubulin alpha chain-like 3 [Linnemannia schmuckeri]